MSLRGQGGYAMAALLVALAVMAVMMSVALPVWRHDAQREKEDELVFRGQQYVRAIRLYNTKFNALPTSVDMLVQQRFLRKKYKDPVTNDDFEPISAANPNPGGATGSTLPGGRGQQATVAGGPPSSSGQLGANSNPNGSTFGGTVPGGMLGVRSKSKDESIRLYLNRNHYNEWMFVFQGLGAGGGRGGPFNPVRDGRGQGRNGQNPGPNPNPSPGPTPFPGPGGRGNAPGGRGPGGFGPPGVPGAPGGGLPTGPGRGRLGGGS